MRPQAMIEQTLNLVTTKDHQQVAVWRIIDDEVFDKSLVGDHPEFCVTAV